MLKTTNITGIRINEICEEFAGKYICWGFEQVCKNKGNCNKCKTMESYTNYCNKNY